MTSPLLLEADTSLVTKLVDQSYVQSREHQAYLEAYRNFIQALERTEKQCRENVIDGVSQYDAASMIIDYVVIAAESADSSDVVDVLKMRIYNTAPPMSEAEMKDYFTKLGRSHVEAISYNINRRDGQYGQGLRQGMLPWNTHGFVVISYDPSQTSERPDGNMMWMYKDKEGYAIRQLPISYDPELDITVDDSVAPTQEVDDIDFPSLIPDEIRKWGGMVFILLGNSILDHTYDGNKDPNKREQETAGKIHQFLTNNTLDGTRCWVSYQTTGSKSTPVSVNGQSIFFDRRRVYSYKEWGQDRMYRPLVSGKRAEKGSPAKMLSGTLAHPNGTIIEWMAGPLYLSKKGRIPMDGTGFIKAAYRDDVHDILPNLSKGEKFARFGLGYGVLRECIGIIMKPPIAVSGQEEFAVEQTRSRSKLVMSGTEEEPPWAEIGEWFEENMPQPIRDLVEEAKTAASSGSLKLDSESIAKELKSTLAGIFGHSSLRESDDGGESGDESDEQPNNNGSDGDADGDGGGDANQRKPILKPNTKGGKKGIISTTASVPEPRWLSNEEWVGEFGDEPEVYQSSPVVYRLGTKGHATVYFQTNHEIFGKVRDHYLTKWLDEHPTLKPYILGDDVNLAVKNAYTRVVLGCIIHTHIDIRDNPSRLQLLAPEHLSTVVRGWENVKQHIQKELEIRSRENKKRYVVK